MSDDGVPDSDVPDRDVSAELVTWRELLRDTTAVLGDSARSRWMCEVAASEDGDRFRIREIAIDRVFIGSCTNSRLSDLREAAGLAKGGQVAAHVEAWVVPGSQAVKRAAESEGLDRIFTDAGFAWREPGCSMCIGMNGDTVPSGKLSVSTSNRNFEGRQGHGARTVLASPMTAAASAITGHVSDPRPFLEEK